MAVPILYPFGAKFSADVVEVFPTVLPPLRGNSKDADGKVLTAPTLVVGRIKAGRAGGVNPPILGCTLTGVAAGNEVRLEFSAKLSSSEADNFFLAGMVQQWRDAKDRPALLRGDRTLSVAYEQNVLAREELIAQAEWALEKNELDVAKLLYERRRNSTRTAWTPRPANTSSAR